MERVNNPLDNVQNNENGGETKTISVTTDQVLFHLLSYSRIVSTFASLSIIRNLLPLHFDDLPT